MDVLWPSKRSVPSPAQDSLKRISASVAVASGLATAGRSVDLSGLEIATGLLCAQVLDLDPVEAAALRPTVAALSENVGTLIEKLRLSAP